MTNDKMFTLVIILLFLLVSIKTSLCRLVSMERAKDISIPRKLIKVIKLKKACYGPGTTNMQNVNPIC